MLMPCDNCAGKELAIFSVTEITPKENADQHYWIGENCIVRFMKRGTKFWIEIQKD